MAIWWGQEVIERVAPALQVFAAPFADMAGGRGAWLIWDALAAVTVLSALAMLHRQRRMLKSILASVATVPEGDVLTLRLALPGRLLAGLLGVACITLLVSPEGAFEFGDRPDGGFFLIVSLPLLLAAVSLDRLDALGGLSGKAVMAWMAVLGVVALIMPLFLWFFAFYPCVILLGRITGIFEERRRRGTPPHSR